MAEVLRGSAGRRRVFKPSYKGRKRAPGPLPRDEPEDAKADLASLTIIEAPAVELLEANGEDRHYDTFRAMSDTYHTAFAAGNAEAIAAMIDFYGGPGTFASSPPRGRAYAVETTPANFDWSSAYDLAPSASLAVIDPAHARAARRRKPSRGPTRQRTRECIASSSGACDGRRRRARPECCVLSCVTL